MDTATGRAIRTVPRPGVRRMAGDSAPEARNKWEAQLLGYQRMPAEVLLAVLTVQLRVPVAQLVSRPGLKAVCHVCGEEIMNEREVVRDELTLCRACAGDGYYLVLLEITAVRAVAKCLA